MENVAGRPAKLGSMYFEKTENDMPIRKFCVGYFDGKKIGLTSWELRELADNLPGYFPDFISRLKRMRISLPE